MVAVLELRRVLDDLLHAARFADLGDPAGIWLRGDRPIAAVGFALEPWPGLAAWTVVERLDALVLHRPWDAPAADLPGVTVFGYHLAFDEALTVGFNPWLADVVGMTGVEPLGAKRGRPLGMCGDVQPATAGELSVRFAAELGGRVELIGLAEGAIDRIAVVGAMWPELVREAADRGAGLYVTGTLRPRAQEAVEDTGIAVLLVGHEPPERWGMKTLSRLVTARLPDLRVVLSPGLA